MRHPILLCMCLTGVVAVSACEKSGDETVERAFQDVNVVDETNLNDVMLTVADPNEAVNYFAKAINTSPDRIDLQRGLAASLIRAKRSTEGVAAWKRVVAMEGATPADSVHLADAMVRDGDWKGAEKTLDSVPPTYETFERYRLEAMVADAGEEWSKADTFYETAVGLTTRPAGVMNNWGLLKTHTRRLCGRGTFVWRRYSSGQRSVYCQKQPCACPQCAAKLYTPGYSNGSDRAGAITSYDGALGGQARRCSNRQNPFARSRRNPSTTL